MNDYSSQYNALYFSSFLEGVDFHLAICGPSVCPPYSICGSGDICVCTQCLSNGTKVCGSDEKTYKDVCELQKVACKSNTTLKMTRNGSCQGRFPLLHFPTLVLSTFREDEAVKKTRNASMNETRNKRRLLFTRKTRKFWLENEMVHTIPFGTFYKL